jgi:hypothetical protein
MSLQPAEQTADMPRLAALARQVTTGTVVPRCFEVWWKNLFRFAAVSLVAFIPLFAAGILMALFAARQARATPAGAPPFDMKVVAWFYLLVLPALALLMALQFGALSHGVVQHLAGRTVRVGGMLSAALRRLVPLTAIAVLGYLAFVVGFVLLVVPGVIVALGLGLAAPASVTERIGPFAAFGRSWRLTRGHRLTFLASGVVVMLVSIAVNSVSQFLLPAVSSGPMLVVMQVVWTIPSLLVAALPATLPAVLYHDLRVLKEGVATEDLLRVFE